MTEIREKLEMKLPKELERLSEAFQAEGASLFVVGGAVRDAVLGKLPKDFDVATELEPDQVISLIQSRIPEWNFIPVGEAFGIVMVRTESGEEFEIATFREDIGEGRRPDAVRFCSIETDVLRRDLTMNALFFDTATSEVVDLVGGLEDLRNGLVCAVGDPFERFREDRLRVLRAVRFAARFEGTIDKATAQAMREFGIMKGYVSPERVRDEFLKGLKSAASVRGFFELLTEFDLVREVFGTGLDVVQLAEVRDPVVLLGLALRGDQIRKQLASLKWTTQEACQIDFLDQLRRFDVKDALLMKRRLVGQARLTEGQLCSFATLSGSSQLVRVVSALMKFEPSVSAEELMAQGFKGRELGEKIAELEAEKFSSLL